MRLEANMRVIRTRPSCLNLYVASAPADDDEAIMLLICTLMPSPAYLCATVEHVASETDLDEETETVHYLRQVGRQIVVFWIPGLSEAQAAAIRARCEMIKKWSVEAFTTAVVRALDAKVQRLQ
jgi:hypothetical protein